ncbi:MAG: hypothetical protein Athens101410_129 [Parcubacteria group bacterium Athens1014_10]|nr:MAG: hypothetical protein Athens101410_129 [Parcubacteria group bacterium Athens1014_10]TSD05902.1 MAG: hypothetical protein Athens071412_184 [Parcubacteria group bacterium Athens0714_12]
MAQWLARLVDIEKVVGSNPTMPTIFENLEPQKRGLFKMNCQKIISQFIKRLEKEGLLDFAEKLNKKFSQSEVYLVGGAVRDALLGLPDEGDYDFVVRKVSANDLENFLTKEGKVFLVGKNFGVFKFLPKGKKIGTPLDIALPRKEHAFGTGGYKDVEVQSNPDLEIKEDLSRRDFTINAFAINNPQFTTRNLQQLIDSFNGLKDLQKKVIRTVGKPEERFKEDYSRMLRALRFACQLDFKIENKTWSAIKKFIPKLNSEIKGERIVSYEIIAKEFLKAFYLNPVKAFDLYDQSGAFKVLMPELLKMKKCSQPKNFHSEGNVWSHTKLALEKLNSKEFKNEFGGEKPGIELILGIIFHDIGKPYTIKTPKKDIVDRIRFNDHDQIGADLAKKICERLKLSSSEEFQIDIDRVVWLVRAHMFFLNNNVDGIKNSTLEKYFFNPKFNGQDLLKLGFIDAIASIPDKGKTNLTNFYKMAERIKNLQAMSKEKEKLPESILDGHEIMKKFKLKPSKQIGELLKILREEQLAKRVKSKKQAFEFLKKHLEKEKSSLLF